MANLFSGERLKEPAPPAPARPRAAAPPPVVKVEPAAPKKEQPFTMEIISGNKKSETKFTNGEGK